MNKRMFAVIIISLALIFVLSLNLTRTLAAPSPDEGRPPASQPAPVSTATPPAPTPTGGSDRDPGGISPADVVHADDVITTGSMCIGYDCLTDGTESFGFDTFKMKENNLQIFFDDTSTTAGFPANDWRIRTNDSSSGGANYFAVDDSTASRTPFKIMAGARNDALFVSSSGRVGLGTNNPILNLHIVSGDSPATRLEQDTSSGWTAQTWDIAGNESNFFIRDVTAGSKLPFRIQPGAPTNSLTVRSDGKVGIGTWAPTEALDVTGNIHAQGNLLAEGYVKELSDVNAKTGFAPVSGQEVLNRLAEVPVTTWSYKDETGVRHMGPMAQDFYSAFGLGSDDRHLAAIDENGVALAAIQELNNQVKIKDAAIESLQSKVDSLEARLNALEAGQPAAGGLNVSQWIPLVLGLLGMGCGALIFRRK